MTMEPLEARLLLSVEELTSLDSHSSALVAAPQPASTQHVPSTDSFSGSRESESASTGARLNAAEYQEAVDEIFAGDLDLQEDDVLLEAAARPETSDSIDLSRTRVASAELEDELSSWPTIQGKEVTREITAPSLVTKVTTAPRETLARAPPVREGDAPAEQEACPGAGSFFRVARGRGGQ